MHKIGAERPYFLPDFDFFHRLFHSDVFVIADFLKFRHQSPMVRALLSLAPQAYLTIPVQNPSDPHPPLNEVKLDNSQPWKDKHLKTLKNRFQSYPFFDFYFPEIEAIYRQQHHYLLDLLRPLLQYQVKTILPEIDFRFASELNIHTENELFDWAREQGFAQWLIMDDEDEYYLQFVSENRLMKLPLIEDDVFPSSYSRQLPLLILQFLQGPETIMYFGEKED
ncbi:MAG: WbqC family protein [Calditrichia bacterium]